MAAFAIRICTRAKSKESLSPLSLDHLKLFPAVASGKGRRGIQRCQTKVFDIASYLLQILELYRTQNFANIHSDFYSSRLQGHAACPCSLELILPYMARPNGLPTGLKVPTMNWTFQFLGEFGIVLRTSKPPGK